MANETGSIIQFKPRGNAWAMIKDLINNETLILTNVDDPVSGPNGTYAGLAGRGSFLLTVTNPTIWINTGTKEEPIWSSLFDELIDFIQVGQIAPTDNLTAEGGVPIHFRLDCNALTGPINIALLDSVRVIGVHIIATAANGVGATLQVFNGGDPITEVIDMNVPDKTIVDATTIDNAFWNFPGSGILTVLGAGAVSAMVLVQAIKIQP